jgi:hypothetical protein
VSDIKIKYIVWRNGRPRFVPGANLRDKGYKGKDLKHLDGRWFNAVECYEWVEQNVPRSEVKTPVVQQKRSTRPERPSQKGYVYFLRSGNDIKIGFSTNPLGRWSSFVTALSGIITSMCFVQGTRWDEKRLHYAFSHLQRSGEWFHATKPLEQVVSASIHAGHIIVPETLMNAKYNPLNEPDEPTEKMASPNKVEPRRR